MDQKTGMGPRPKPQWRAGSVAARIPIMAPRVQSGPHACTLGGGTTPQRRFMMRPHQARHQAYCDVDLHTRTMFLCLLKIHRIVVAPPGP